MPIKTSETFISEKNTHNITIYSNPPDSKKYPVVFLLHGNFGLVSPYGDQIQSFANDLANLGYTTAVPHYYLDDKSHLDDTVPKVQILADAIATVVNRAEVDPNRIGLVGFSLGATTAMSYISSNASTGVKVLVDFFGFTTPTIQAGISRTYPTNKIL
jgi:dienelactone hydrolase